jgi:uncharacterized membrane protein YqjE
MAFFKSSSSRPLDQSEIPFQYDGISARLLGVSGALLEHLLALFSLATAEIQELFGKILVSLFLCVATLFFLLIAYLSLITALVAFIVATWHLAWPIVLGSMALLHFGIGLGLIFLLRYQRSYSPLAMTRLELQRDIESLKKKKSSLS